MGYRYSKSREITDHCLKNLTTGAREKESGELLLVLVGLLFGIRVMLV